MVGGLGGFGFSDGVGNGFGDGAIAVHVEFGNALFHRVDFLALVGHYCGVMKMWRGLEWVLCNYHYQSVQFSQLRLSFTRLTSGLYLGLFWAGLFLLCYRRVDFVERGASKTSR